MQLRTTSETLSFIKDKEHQLIEMYILIKNRFPEFDTTGLLSTSIKEIKGYIQELDRSYYSVITDALEGCFGFDLTAETYSTDADISKDHNCKECLQKVINAEKTLLALYKDAADQSASLLADVPRAMRIIYRKRTSRLEKINALKDAMKE